MQGVALVEKDYISIPLSLAAIKHITEILAESVAKNIVNEDLSEVQNKEAPVSFD